MNIFGFRPFKGKFNLGNSDDIPENQDGTLIGSIKQINTALSNKVTKQSLIASWYGRPANDSNAALRKQIRVPFPNGIQPTNATLLAARSPGHTDYFTGTTVSIEQSYMLVTLSSTPSESEWLDIIVSCTYD